jgi:hypothetical protein
MNTLVVPNYSELSAVIPLHFNTFDNSHALSLDSFTKTSYAAQEILNGLNKELFKGKFKYEVVILPPNEGSFLAFLGLAGGTIVPAAFKFLESDIGKGYVKGLTGQEPKYWSEKIGEFKSQQVNKAVEATLAAGKILKESAKGFLQKQTKELETDGITPGVFSEAYLGRNKFYSACRDDQNILGVGFNKKHDFPISRNKFYDFATTVPDEDSWILETLPVTALSPDWSGNTRRWYGKFKGNRAVYFEVRDSALWQKASQNNLDIKAGDQLVVQWARKKHSGKQSAIVWKVLQYNGQKISDPLPIEELTKLHNRFEVPDEKQLELF